MDKRGKALSRKRKADTAIDRLLIEGATGRKTTKNVEESLRATAGSVSVNNIKFVPFDPPFLSSSATIDENKVILLKPDENDLDVIPLTPLKPVTPTKELKEEPDTTSLSGTSRSEPVDCYVAASSGALKGLNFAKSSAVNLNEGSVKELVPSADGISAMCFANDSGQQKILTCHGDRRLRLFDPSTGQWRTMLTVEGGNGPVRDVHFVESTQRIITGVESGVIRIWDAAEALRQDATTSEAPVVEGRTLNVGSHLAAMRLHPSDENRLATGGKENLLKVWDLEAGRTIFSSKNVRHDNLELRVPIDERNLQFVGADGRYLVTTTGAHQIRLYDPRAQRRPISELEWLDSLICALSTCYLENHIIAGNNTGDLGHFDLRYGQRNTISLVSKYRGFAGAVRCISAHPTAPLFASCGVDRFVIVHNLTTRVPVKKVQLNRILLCEKNSITNPPRPKKEEVDEDENDEDDASGSEHNGDRASDEDEADEDDSVESLDDLLEAA